MISKFVPRDFLKLLKVQRISDVKLGHSAQTSLAVLHCQIANFDALTQSMNPQEKFMFVMKYLGNLGPLIRLNGGYIDKVCKLFKNLTLNIVLSPLLCCRIQKECRCCQSSNRYLPVH